MFEVLVSDPSQVAEARRRAAAAAVEAGFGEVAIGQASLVATELSSNLIKHGGGGRLLVGAGNRTLDLLALDSGAGMADVQACMADGYSTAGTRGQGLGAVQRLAQSLDVGSWPGGGTVAWARLVSAEGDGPGGLAQNIPRPPVLRNAGVWAVQTPMPGEDVCGDGWDWHGDAAGRTVFVVDGLGHGTEAALAANAALAVFRRHADAPPTEIVEAVHQGIRHTRGGAIAAARIDWASATVTFAGLGNIAGALLLPSGQTRRMVSLNGTAGHNARKVQSFEYPCPDNALMVMHSDGIGTGWSGERYTPLLWRHPMLMAGALYRDFNRGRDDATVVVCGTGRP
ncbi:anti-sigma regulatory factor [Aquabacterium soli]|uniref:Anti-sigma regulatory factor n=1 Tax=Aquabacterium soli TaxID=2493092 RepID=A0A426VCQ3_9BURK|nr:SpoIIE family protein phosphatase [Aquabacterium soli]RRS04647.1 anti-sigma regulatory factor [Aquabacterium soli]